MTIHQLTERQERFISEYLIDQNASAAARRAGYSPRTKGSQAAEMMKHPVIAERIRVGLLDMHEQLGISAMNVMRELARAAFFDPREAVDQSGRMLPLHEMSEQAVLALSVNFSPRANGEIATQVRQAPRMPALLALARQVALIEKLKQAAAAVPPEVDHPWGTVVPGDPVRRYLPGSTLEKEEAQWRERRRAEAVEKFTEELREQHAAQQAAGPALEEAPPTEAAHAAGARDAEPGDAEPRAVAQATRAQATPTGETNAALAGARAGREPAAGPTPRAAPPSEMPQAPAPRDGTRADPHIATPEARDDARGVPPKAPVPPPPTSPPPTSALPPLITPEMDTYLQTLLDAYEQVELEAMGESAAETEVERLARTAADQTGQWADAEPGSLPQEQDDAAQSEDANRGEMLFTPAPEPAPTPAPIKRRRLNLWGEGPDAPRKRPPQRELPRDGSNIPPDFVFGPGVRVPGPWETFAGGPRPPGIVKDRRPQFAVGAGEFQWSDEYLDDGAD